MQQTTAEQPTPEQVADALRCLAELIHLPEAVTPGASHVVVSLLPRDEEPLRVLLAGLADVYREPITGNGRQITATGRADLVMWRWSGRLLSWRVVLLAYGPRDDEQPQPAAVEPEPTPDDLCPDPWHFQPTEPTEPCPACGDEPPAPAPTATGWPIVAAPEPAAPADDDGRASWATVGLAAVVDGLPRPHARGLVPRTDPALIGHVPGQLVDGADATAARRTVDAVAEVA